ncbi:MAG: alginate O-acetyltransferase AlgX-related protein [Planctomycetota bacterium]|jgi:hypothetical protein
MTTPSSPDHPPNAARRFADRVLLVGMLVVLALPFADWALDLQLGDPHWEHRPLAPPPAPPADAAALAAWPGAAERWVNDHVGGRRTFIQLWNGANLALLGRSPVDHVIAGADGWLYEAFPRSRRCYRGETLAPELRDAWVRVLQARAAWCAARGIDYCVVVIPTKAAVHGAAFPHGPAVAPRAGPGPQLLAALPDGAAAGPLHVVDAGAVLRAAGAEAEVFFRRDHHWNARGALVTLDAVAAALGPRHAALGDPAASARTFVDRRGFAGNLARQLALEPFWHEPEPVAQPAPTRTPRTVAPPAGAPPRTGAAETPGAAGPHTVLFGDSFTIELASHLAPRCRRLVVARHRPSQTAAWLGGPWLDRERPAVVIELLRERMLWLPPQAPGP